MASVNKVILVGNLGRDPEIRYSPDGTPVCTVSIATTSQWKDKASGERREETEWHKVVFYSRLAEIAGEYLKKGRPVYIEGRLKTRKWEDKKTGGDRFSTEVIADQMQMLGGAGQGGGGHAADAPDGYDSQTRNVGGKNNSYAAQKDGSVAPASGSAALADMDDDIPF